ncbi:protein of unknown function DUF255 [Chloroherpeton thalassium ATCC 35110]|uniref:Spermatogenesis-associated protein 20-like TRX domain-containing protein n=1 Tax=Chloroherpeton thalassium (strain ATCC 35110 / GB-78) TaxID=517418 RepID=B3QRQ9_CHLT3|nr:thioredoxin domain-containing protein [Chloroherpeton thalassium]ACF13862.1 protein of unknown function DUF255 [Chloroherpeton thalassium ATCC 35110]
MSNPKKEPNRLSREKSPYLLQHAYNPVDWFAWGDEAFEKARSEEKPIFLSIGYSTCHWCHVMERESFENEEIARILNEHFVSIKVDREEHPDLDKVYMTYVQASTGSGGWPMSVWLTPELKPFFGGTYFPPSDSYGRPGFGSMLLKIAESWQQSRERVLQAAGNISEQLQAFSEMQAEAGAKVPDEAAFQNTFAQFESVFDKDWGGFGNAPKFPRPAILNFLFTFFHQTKNEAALRMALHTLRKMADGGMHDHISVPGKGGGGFARYSTDAYWHVPHFEKMLYDNAQLASAYLDAYQITSDRFFADTARDIFNYVLCDMTAPEGGFYSAEDADSLAAPESPEKTEGAFYVWERAEIDALLGDEASQIFSFIYGVHPGGNASVDPHGEFKGKNILIRRATLSQAAQEFGKSEADIAEVMAKSRERLFDARLQRPRPHRDDKILTAWNGLMISAFAKGYMVLDEATYLHAAQKAADFVIEKLYNKETGGLLRRYRDGESAIDGKADDYAFFVQALIDLYEASFQFKYLSLALDLAEKQNALFYDAQNGGFFSSTSENKSVIFRLKDDQDGAEPSANSVAALNLLRLSQMADREDFRQKAEATVNFFGKILSEAGNQMPQMFAALSFLKQKPKQIILTGAPDSPELRALRKAIDSVYEPVKVLLHATEETAGLTSFLSSLSLGSQKPTAYICINYACRLPTSEPAKVREFLVE